MVLESDIACECTIVSGKHVAGPSYIPNIVNVSINPSDARGYNLGTITMTIHGFTYLTGPYLLGNADPFQAGSYCDFVRIQGSINWNQKMKCAPNQAFSSMIVPGDEPASGRTLLIPLIQSPIIVETGDGKLPQLPAPYELELDEAHLLNVVDGADAHVSPSYTLDGASGPVNKFRKGYRREYKWGKFKFGIHDLFTFDTKTCASGIEVPSEITIAETDSFKVVPQSFSLVVEPPSPATLTFTYTYEDENRIVQELDNCLDFPC